MAINYLQQELDARLAKGKSARLDQASGISYTKEQQAAVRALFGTDEALAIRPLPAAGRSKRYALRIPGNQYNYGGSRSTWPEVKMQLVVAPGGKVEATGTWDGIDIRDGDFSAAFHGIDIHANHTPDTLGGGLLGKMRFGVDSIVFSDNANDKLTLRIEQSKLSLNTSRQGQNIEHRQEFSIGRLAMAGIELNDIHMAYRLRNLNSVVLGAYSESLLKQTKPSADIESRIIDDLLKPLLKRGASLDIDDLSARYAGAKTQLKGSVSMPAASDEDFSSAERILNKIVARFEVRLPLQSMRAVVHQFQTSASKSAPAAVDAQQIYEYMLGKALAGGYARLEKDELVSVIEISKGQLRINGRAETHPLWPLLQELIEQSATPPAQDDTPPVVVEWRDRSVENLRLFAGNKKSNAITALCQNYLNGKGVPKDSAEAYKWCSQGAEMGAPLAQILLADMYRDGNGVPQDRQLEQHWRKQADEAPQDTGNNVAPTPEVPVQVLDTAAGYFNEQFFRFDEAKTRSLEVVLEQPKPHKKWGAMLSVCLSADAPSDVACVRLARRYRDQDVLNLTGITFATDFQSVLNEESTDVALTLGEKVQLDVFVLDQKAYFVVNGEHTIVRDIVFQPQLIQLTCSTATCRMGFGQH